METTEARLQQECYIYFNNTYPHLRGLFFKIKNEGTNKITGARDKATGLVAGVADSCLLINKTAVFIEFKTETGKKSQAQKEWEKIINEAGYQYFIIRSIDQFKELIQYNLQIGCGYCISENNCILRVNRTINYAKLGCKLFKHF